MMQVVVIPANGAKVAYVDKLDAITYKFLSDKVGGMVEVVGLGPVNTAEMSMYLNEEGKIMRLAKNSRATSLAKRHGAISLMDYIAGDAVVVGAVDEDGEDTGLEQEQIDELMEEIGH
jgi:hypothetical protein